MGSTAVNSDYGATRELSALQKERALYRPELPPCLLQGTAVRVEYGDATIAADGADAHVIGNAFPHTYGQPLAHFLPEAANAADAAIITEHPVVRVGVVFSGRQSPGGHNVIWGLHDALSAHNPSSKLIGFLGGTDGLFAQKTLEITEEVLSSYKNQGGYDMLGRTRDQIRTTEQVKAAMTTCQTLMLDALVIIGGVTSNTDAAQLAETFAESKCSTKIVGVPVTLNGDLKNQFVETTVGFDTICKVNSQLISNICTDALSAEKYYYSTFCLNLLGNRLVLIFFFTFIIPLSGKDFVALFFASVVQLLLHPESDDSAQLSQIEIEKLLAQLVETEINKRLEEGTYKGKKFNAICHFFGYQARGALPSKFDCDYAYVLGHVCYHILAAGLNGYMATVTNLKNHLVRWKCGAAPITSMMTVKGWSRGPAATQIGKPAVHMASVDLKRKAYELLRQNSSSLLMEDIYKNPGPLQFEGPGAEAKPISLCVEDRDYMGRIKQLQEYLEKVKCIVKPGCSQDVLKAALSAMAHVIELLTIMSSPSYSGQAATI